MPLSWNEIKSRALAFSREWADETSEDAEAKTFWNDFFHVFGVSRRRVASFESRVKKVDGKDGYIDLLWKGMLPALLKAHQALDKAVDAAYGKTRFNSEAERVAFLFDLYLSYNQRLAANQSPAKKTRSSKPVAHDRELAV